LWTGPLLWARVPEGSTSTDVGFQEKGGVGPTKSARHPSTTAALPRITEVSPQKTASGARNR
jgi:hypothetical protein